MSDRSENLTKSETEALDRVRKFVSKAKSLIEDISVEHLIEEGGVNPYLAKSLGMRTIDEVVDFFVTRRVERSLGTSFGNVLDDVIRILLGAVKGNKLFKTYGSWIKWWDAVLLDRKVVMSIKSGPADMDKDQVELFVQRAREAEGKGFRPFLVFAYGKHAFPVIEGYLNKWGFGPDKYLRIGKAVFEEFGEGTDYYREVLKVFDIAGKGAGDIFAMTEEKMKALTEEARRRYKGDVDKMLDDMF